MNHTATRLAFFFIAAYCFPVTARADESPKPVLVDVQRILNKAPHNAFTDLVRFHDTWFCTFREADRHAGGRDGVIRVIWSDDGSGWKSAALLTEEAVDLRDPKLCITPDGRLMLVAGGSIYENAKDKYLTRAPRVAFSRDGRRWSMLTKVLAEDHWLWRVTWHRGKAYSVSKLGAGRDPRRVMLYSSSDGLDWQWITEFRAIPAWPNEATVRFLDDDEMVILLRRNKTAWIGTSRPPYTQWTWHDTGHRIGGPNFIRLPSGDLWAAGRHYDGKGEAKTVLARMTRKSYEPVLELPSGGDTSYPGMVFHQGLLWMSYYSSHEGKTSIYLAKVKFEKK